MRQLTKADRKAMERAEAISDRILNGEGQYVRSQNYLTVETLGEEQEKPVFHASITTHYAELTIGRHNVEAIRGWTWRWWHTEPRPPVNKQSSELFKSREECARDLRQSLREFGQDEIAEVFGG